MKRSRRARGATCILHGAPRHGQDIQKYNPIQGAPDPAATAALRAPQLDTIAEGALAPDMPPPYMVAGALALNSADSLAHSVLSRAVFLADAPAATLATPYELRRAGRQLAIDAAELCHALAGVRAFILASTDAHAAALRDLGGALDEMSGALDEMGGALDEMGEALDTLDALTGLDAAELLASDTAEPESEGAPHAS